MHTRRLPLLMLLVLLPIPAQADRHKTEFFAGLSTGSVTGRFSLGVRPWSTPLFVFVEGADFVTGRDSGHFLDERMIGLRYRFPGERRLEPFVHGMVGCQSPSRPEGVEAATVSSTAAAVGGGVDYELTLKDSGLIWLVRLQGDAVGSWPSAGFDPHLRATVGLALRWEGRH